MIPSIAPDGRHGVRLRRFIGHAAANLLDVEEVTTSEGLAALAPAWDGLHERSGVTHPFLTHAFVRAYWEALGVPGSLLVLVVRRYDQVIAIAPLVRRHRTLYGLSVRAIETLRHPYAPRADILLSTHPTQACGALLEHLLRTGSSWDVLELANVLESSVAYRELRRIARLAGVLTGVEKLDGSSYLEEPAGRDARLAARMRRLEREGEVSFETVSGGPALGPALHDLARLKALGPEADAERFYRTLARRASTEGWLRLQFVKLGERRIAAVYALRYGGTHFVWKIGSNPEFARFSPGQLATTLSIEDAFADGVREVDFLGQGEPATGVRPQRSLSIFPGHFRARCLYVAKFGVLPRLKRTGLLRALREALARDEEPR
ncbi:MAG TPA: GNAT family N-acetyltransferase [Candidatus Bathyarchaeia archaeon]|nr:GNAT family N-acetyltransferase [Candidatus Bathyarchaeia archaeon]